MPNWTVRNFPRPGQLDPSQSVGTMAPGGGGRFAGMRPQLDPSQSVGTAVSDGEGRERITHPGVGPRTYDPNAAPPAGLMMPNASPMMGGGQGPNLGWRPQESAQMVPGGGWPGGNQPPQSFGGGQMVPGGGWPGDPPPAYGAGGGANDPYRPLLELLRQRLQVGPRTQPMGQQGGPQQGDQLTQMIMALLSGQGWG